MSISFTSKLKTVLNQIEKYPSESMNIDLAIPFQLRQKVNNIFIQLAKKKKDGNRMISKEISSNRIEQTIRNILYKFQSIGITYESNSTLIENSITYSLEYIIENYPVHLVWSPVNLGVTTLNKEVINIDKQINLTNYKTISPWKELLYGVENSLFFWTGNYWKITPLGNFFKTLSTPTATVFLLMLENYLNVPENTSPFSLNPHQMSKAFLKGIMTNKNVFVSIGDEQYDLIKLDPNMEFLDRLNDFQLIDIIDITEERRGYYSDSNLEGIPTYTLGDDFYSIKLIDYGREILQTVLDESPNYLKEMIKNLISFELSGNEYFEVRDSKIYNKILRLAEKYPEITGDQLDPIKEITSALKGSRESILIIRTLPPTIEKILKNILIEYSIVEKGDSSITLKRILLKFEKCITTKKTILNYNTIQFIKSIGRDSLMHGSTTPNGEIRKALTTLMLNVLLRIYEEYELNKRKEG